MRERGNVIKKYRSPCGIFLCPLGVRAFDGLLHLKNKINRPDFP
ncbi:hypothetical protein KNP414_04660 [Paenibacillus mucilaginosus KNP414]|uniref:Uncharacterized protein n=1 Tax=Paenibacillus mucilaginosus (strain KNP414) TaxID=1036673 RepID=F8FDZ0_PAEMK|nr:hypothetical protein KNP414_04660 [Paenibacillus mucilaginosus KNP414]